MASQRLGPHAATCNWGPSCGTQVPAAKLLAFSFTMHSCLDRCEVTAQPSEEHTQSFHYLSSPDPQHYQNPVLKRGPGDCDKLYSCLLLRTVNGWGKELYCLNHGMKMKGKRWKECLRKTNENRTWGTSELILQGSVGYLAVKTVLKCTTRLKLHKEFPTISGLLFSF